MEWWLIAVDICNLSRKLQIKIPILIRFADHILMYIIFIIFNYLMQLAISELFFTELIVSGWNKVVRERGRLPVIACCCEMCRQTAGLITFLQCLFQPWIGSLLHTGGLSTGVCVIVQLLSVLVPERTSTTRCFCFVLMGLGDLIKHVCLSSTFPERY